MFNKQMILKLLINDVVCENVFAKYSTGNLTSKSVTANDKQISRRTTLKQSHAKLTH